MHILIVSQYFWPENFRINDIASELASRGHKVTVLTGKPNYPNGSFYKGYSMFSVSNENWNGIHIIRVPLIPRGNGHGILLFLNYFSFAFFASIKALLISRTIDRIFVYEPSPITVGLPAILAKKMIGAPIIFWVQDLWPESIAAAGGIHSKFILKLADKLTRYTYEKSSKILIQSKAFTSYLLDQKVPAEKIIYFPNPAEHFYKIVEPKQKYLLKLPIGFKLMFAGNIGQGQSFDTLLKASYILKKENIDIKWIILGDGRMKSWVLKQIEELGIKDTFYLLGSYPAEEMPSFFACADALLVSLKKNPIFAMTIPAKVQSYLACGKPLIGSLDGEGARILIESQAGLIAPAEDPEKLVHQIKKIFFMDDLQRKKMGENARKYYDSEFGRGMLLNKLEDLLIN